MPTETLERPQAEIQTSSQIKTAVGLRIRESGGTQEQYDAAMEELDVENNPIEGLIFHSSGPVEGGWGTIDVWESREAFDRFQEDWIDPAFQVLSDRGYEQPAESVVEEFTVTNYITHTGR